MFDNVPLADALTLTVNVKTALPIPRVVIEQDTVPAIPTDGVVQLQPPGDESDPNVVPAGNVSVSETDAALLGPALFTVIV